MEGMRPPHACNALPRLPLCTQHLLGSDYVLIPLWIGNRGPLNMLVDTGVPGAGPASVLREYPPGGCGGAGWHAWLWRCGVQLGSVAPLCPSTEQGIRLSTAPCTPRHLPLGPNP